MFMSTPVSILWLQQSFHTPKGLQMIEINHNGCRNRMNVVSQVLTVRLNTTKKYNRL